MIREKVLTAWTTLQEQIKQSLTRHPLTKFWQNQLQKVEQQIHQQEEKLKKFKTSLVKDELGRVSVSATTNWSIWEQKGQVQAVISKLVKEKEFLTKLITNPRAELEHCQQELTRLSQLEELIQTDQINEVKRMIQRK